MAGNIAVLRRNLWSRLVDKHGHFCAYMLAGIGVGMTPFDAYLHRTWWVVFDIAAAAILVAMGTLLELRAKSRREAWDRLRFPYGRTPYE